MRGDCTACVSAIASQWHQALLLDGNSHCWSFLDQHGANDKGLLCASAAVQGANQAAAAAMLEHPTIFIGQVSPDSKWCTGRGHLVAGAAGLTIAAVSAALHCPQLQ